MLRFGRPTAGGLAPQPVSASPRCGAGFCEVSSAPASGYEQAGAKAPPNLPDDDCSGWTQSRARQLLDERSRPLQGTCYLLWGSGVCRSDAPERRRAPLRRARGNVTSKRQKTGPFSRFGILAGRWLAPEMTPGAAKSPIVVAFTVKERDFSRCVAFSLFLYWSATFTALLL